MPRKLIFKETGINQTSNAPDGYRFVGYDGVVISEKFGATVSALGGGSSYTYEIGEYVADKGGVIFHRYKDGGQENYLVVDTVNLSTSHWSDVNATLIGYTAQSTWDGLSNSNSIVAQSLHTSSAAKLCLDSTNNGQSDWYLPSIDELSLLWQNRTNLNKTLSGNSSFGPISGSDEISISYSYWSSTEFSDSGAWLFGFYNISTYSSGKDTFAMVRAVRRFSI